MKTKEEAEVTGRYQERHVGSLSITHRDRPLVELEQDHRIGSDKSL